MEAMNNNLAQIAEKHYGLKVGGDTYQQIMAKLVEYFSNMRGFQSKACNPNCKKCYGRGFTVPSNGGRLIPCPCWREKDV